MRLSIPSDRSEADEARYLHESAPREGVIDNRTLDPLRLAQRN
jgi:hypothetical protein